MIRTIRNAWVATAGLLLMAIPAAAQIQLGETSTKGSGTLSTGYSANYGNMTPSAHGWTFGGVADFSGSFHSPNFLSYDVSPYLNQSRANSNFQSISNASGVNLSAGIFAGSKFPGSVTYSKAYNSDGNYAIPGLADFVTHGDSDNFGITWSENIPDAPSFSASFQTGSSQYSVYGSDQTGDNSYHTINLHSGYRWAGFNLGAYFTTGNGNSTIPPVVAGTPLEVNSDNTSYGLNASHTLPLSGNFGASVNRSTWNTDYLGIDTNGAIDTVNVNAGIHPAERWSVSGSLNYSDNLAGQIIQAVVTAGGVVPGLDSSQSSDSFDVMGVTSYTPIRSMQTSAFFEHRSQSFLGQDYGVNSYGGAANFTHWLMGGTLNASVSLSANSSLNHGEDTIGLSASENYSIRFHGWHLNESFSYAQNMQTLLVTYLNSYYNYAGNINRHWGLFNLSVGGGGGRSALSDQAGSMSSSETLNGSIGYGSFITATGSYSKADGQALLTGTGLVGLPVPVPVVPSSLVSLYGGKSFSAGVSSMPTKKLVLGGTYAKSSSNTFTNGIASANENSQYNALLQYQVRKLNVVAGYARLEQGFGGTSSRAQVISSYYMGISRWFNFF